jgi:hypothetical protein
MVILWGCRTCGGSKVHGPERRGHDRSPDERDEVSDEERLSETLNDAGLCDVPRITRAGESSRRAVVTMCKRCKRDAERMRIRLGAYCAVEITERK